MMRYITIGALTACLGLAAALWWQSGRVDALRDDNARLTRNAVVLAGKVAQAKVAATVAASVARKERDANATTTATIERLLTSDFGECADALLDPDLADILNGLRNPR